MDTNNSLLRHASLVTGIALSIAAFSASAQTALKNAKAFSSPSASLSAEGSAMSSVHPKLDSMLGGMAASTLGGDRKSGRISTPSSMLINGKVTVIAVAQPGQAAQLRAQAEALGMSNISMAENTVHGQLSPAALGQLGALSTLNFARMGGPVTTHVGSVTTQGDRAMKSDVARLRTNLDGTGVKIGVISNSFNALGGTAAGVASGNLPGTGNPNGFNKPVQIIADIESNDEGRAMAELIHDVAPGAEILFHTGFLGEASLAGAIRELARQGAKVIVDDVGYANTPAFQDGLAARAVDDVVAAGVTYFSSAGNSARQAYEDYAFPGSPETILAPNGDTIGTYRPHLFISRNGDVSPFLKVTVRKNAEGAQTMLPIVQWSQPSASLKEGSAGSKTDWDIFVSTEPNFDSLIAASFDTNFGRDPIDSTAITINGPVGSTFDIYIAIMAANTRDANPIAPDSNNWFAPLDRLRFTLFSSGANLVETDAEPAGTIIGHSNAAGAITLCAAEYDAVDASGNYVPQSFTSVGGVNILVNKNGFRTYQDREKPDLCGPDGGNTSFFAPNGPNDFDNDGFPNFNGTSASAPHAAAVGALMKQARPDLRPNQIRHILKNTARDMKDPFSPFSPFDSGQDTTTGAGFLDADRALRSLGR